MFSPQKGNSLAENASFDVVWSLVDKIDGPAVFSARHHMLSALYAIARPSVRPSHGWITQKTVEGRIMKLLAYGSPIPLVFAG